MLGRSFGRSRPISTGLIACVLLTLTIYGLATALPDPRLMDYGSFYASGEAAAAGLNPYAIYPLTFHVTLPGFESWNPNLNPPVSLPLFELFAKLDPHYGFRLWWAVSATCYAAAIWLLMRRYFGEASPVDALWLVTLAGFWDTLTLGQIYTPLVLAIVGAWLCLERDRAVVAGLLLGLVVAFKPNFLVLPVLMLLAGHARPALATIASASVLTLLPLFRYGSDVYVWWGELVLGDTGRPAFLTNASLSGLSQRLGSAELGIALSAALLAGLAYWAVRKRPVPLEATAAGVIGAVLASPIAWVHYTLFLLPVFFWFRRSLVTVSAAALLVVPVPAVLLLSDSPSWMRMTFGSVYGWAVVLCLIALLFNRKPIEPNLTSADGATALKKL